MSQSVIAIGLDGTDPLLLEQWVRGGSLPNFAKLWAEGGYTRLENSIDLLDQKVGFSATEPSWVMFSSGCLPATTGYWDITKYDPETYGYDASMLARPYGFQEYPPFFDLGRDYRVCTFDLPVWTPSGRINGPQVMGWGGHFSAGERQSSPEPLLEDLQDRFGRCNVFMKDHGVPWDRKYHDWLESELKVSIGKRGKIVRHLLNSESPDLFIANFPEGHSAGHDLLHYSQQSHPLYAGKRRSGEDRDPVLSVYQAIDREIGEILAEAPADASVLLFSVHGMAENHSDLLTMAFLPELLYRYSFPGKAVLTTGETSMAPGPVMKNPLRSSWPGTLWTQRYESNRVKRMLRPWLPARFLKSGNDDELASPYNAAKAQLSWMPASWYRRQWPRMQAFGLPTFWEGRIRLNLEGREGQGVVAREDYDRVCSDLAAFISRVTDARTGKPVAKRVLRTRRTPVDNDPKLPNFDLLVEWHDRAVDVIDSPDVGRIGPIPYARSGSHRPRGFLLAKGPRIAPGSELPPGGIVDLAPSILSLLGAPIPDHLDGASLFDPQAPAGERLAAAVKAGYNAARVQSAPLTWLLPVFAAL